jgi:hypothetical protein
MNAGSVAFGRLPSGPWQGDSPLPYRAHKVFLDRY